MTIDQEVMFYNAVAFTSDDLYAREPLHIITNPDLPHDSLKEKVRAYFKNHDFSSLGPLQEGDNLLIKFLSREDFHRIKKPLFENEYELQIEEAYNAYLYLEYAGPATLINIRFLREQVNHPVIDLTN